MFTISITYGSGFSVTARQPCIVDRLVEAERHAVNMVNRLFPDVDVVMVHSEDLTYDVFPVDEPIAQVKIETGVDGV